MLEVNDVAPRGKRPSGRGADCAPIAARAPQPAGTTEDFMIGEDAQRRHDKSAVERANGERRAADIEQLFQPLELPFVIAENDGRWWSRDDLSQTLQVAIHMLGRSERESLLGLGVRNRNARESCEPAAPGIRVQQQVIARRRLL